MAMILCKIKYPDQVVYHWHGRTEKEECINVSTDFKASNMGIIMHIDNDSDVYTEMKFRQLIVEEIEGWDNAEDYLTAMSRENVN